MYSLLQRYNSGVLAQERLEADNRRLRADTAAAEKSNARLTVAVAAKDQELGTAAMKVGGHRCGCGVCQRLVYMNLPLASPFDYLASLVG